MAGDDGGGTRRQNEYVLCFVSLYSVAYLVDVHFAEEGQEEIQKFVKKLSRGRGQRPPKLEKSIRSMARNVQPFLPEVATMSRELAKACFLISGTNYMCRFHQIIAKRQGKIDGENTKPGEPKVMGVAYKKLQAGVPPEPGFFSCGCSEEDVLMDFYFWKTWEITSPVTGITEGWLAHALDLRSRAFVTAGFRSLGLFTLDELYTGDRDPPTHLRHLREIILDNVQHDLYGSPGADVDPE